MTYVMPSAQDLVPTPPPSPKTTLLPCLSSTTLTSLSCTINHITLYTRAASEIPSSLHSLIPLLWYHHHTSPPQRWDHICKPLVQNHLNSSHQSSTSTSLFIISTVIPSFPVGAFTYNLQAFSSVYIATNDISWKVLATYITTSACSIDNSSYNFQPKGNEVI